MLPLNEIFTKLLGIEYGLNLLIWLLFFSLAASAFFAPRRNLSKSIATLAALVIAFPLGALSLSMAFISLFARSWSEVERELLPVFMLSSTLLLTTLIGA